MDKNKSSFFILLGINEIKKQASDSRDIRVIQIIHITLGDYNTGDTRNSR